MAEIGSAFLSILPSAKGFGSKLESEVGRETKGSGKKIGSLLGGAVKGGAIAAIGAGVVATGFLKSAVGDAREAQKVTAATNAIIKATGGAANVSAEGVAHLAGTLAAKTGVDDGQIQAGENLLLTFKNVKSAGEGLDDIFARATKAGLDLASAGFGSVEGNAVQLGKALNDPLKGIAALSKSGVTFTEGQKEQIKGFVASNDLLSAQKIILGEVEAQVGGTAEATATSGEKAAYAFGEIKESVGTFLLPVLDKLGVYFTDKIAPAISSFVDGIKAGTGSGGKFRDILMGLYERVLKPLGGFITGTIVPAIKEFIRGFQEGTGLGGKFKDFLVGLGDTLRPIGLFIINTAVPAIKKFIGQMNSGEGAGGVFVDILGLLWGALKKAADFVIRTLIPNLAQFVGFVIRKVVPKVLSLGIALLKMASFGIKAFTFLLDAAFGCFEGILNAADKGLGWIPGLGDKIHNANEAFSKFRDSTINKLKDVAKKTDSAADALDRLAHPRSTTFTTYFVSVGTKNKGNRDDAITGGAGSPKAIAGMVKKNVALLEPVGKSIAEGVEKGIEKGGKKAKEKLQKLIDDLRSKLQDLRGQMSSLASSIAESFRPDLFSGGLADFFTAGQSGAGNLASVIAAFKKLRGFGLSEKFLSDLYASGNSGLILDLASGDRNTATAAQGLYTQTNALANSLGQSVARNEFGDDIARLADRLEKALDRLPKKTGHEVGRAINGAAVRGRRDARV